VACCLGAPSRGGGLLAFAVIKVGVLRFSFGGDGRVRGCLLLTVDRGFLGSFMCGSCLAI
jgi:hypothetical protein